MGLKTNKNTKNCVLNIFATSSSLRCLFFNFAVYTSSSVWNVRHFPKQQLPMGIYPRGNFPSVQFPKWPQAAMGRAERCG